MSNEQLVSAKSNGGLTLTIFRLFLCIPKTLKIAKTHDATYTVTREV